MGCQYSAKLCKWDVSIPQKTAETPDSIGNFCKDVSMDKFSGFCSLPILRRGHLVTAAELLVEGCAVGKAAHLGNEGDGVVGTGEQAGGMVQTEAVDESLGALTVGIFADGIVDIAVVGAEHRGERVAVQVGIGKTLLLLHQFDKTEEELLTGLALLFGLPCYALDVAHLMLLLLLFALNQLKEFTVLDEQVAVGNDQSPQGNENDEDDGDEREGDDAIGVGLGAVVRRPAFRAGSKGQHG